MKRRRLGEYWDNLDFRHPERLNFRVRFRFKKAPFSPPFVYKPFSKSQKNEKNTRHLPIHRQPPFGNLIYAFQTSPPNP